MNQQEQAAALAFEQDYELVYPTLHRSDLEQLLAAIFNVDAFADGPGAAAAIDPWSPHVGARIASFGDAVARAGYVRRIRGLVLLTLTNWKEIDEPPKASDMYEMVRTIEGV